MIDNNKLLSRDRVATGRNVVTIKRNLIKIDSLLKERLVLVKVRQGILRQQEQNRMRRQREEDLEGLQSTSVQTDTPDKQGSNFLSGLVKSILGLSGIFLPQLLRLLNFLKRIVDPIKNMATATFKALSSFLKVGTMAVDKISDAFNFKGSTLKGLDETTITNKFNKFEFALNTFVNALLFAGAMQTLSSLPDIKLVQNFLKKFKKLPVTKVTTGNQIPFVQPPPAKASASVLEKIFDLRNLQKPVETFSVPIKDRRFRVNPKGRKINPEDGRFFAKRKKSKITFESFEKTIRNIETKIPEFELFEFLRGKNLASPTLLKVEINKLYATELRTLQDLNTDGKLVGNAYTQALGLLNDKYDNTVKSIDDYGKEIIKYFKKGNFDAPLSNILQKLVKIGEGGEEMTGKLLKYNIDYEDFVPPKVPMGGGPGGNNFLNPFKESQFFDPMNPRASVIGGGFSDSFFNKSITKPSRFKQSMNFLKGIDETMTDFATRQTSRLSKVIMSGPLKGLQEGAEKMLKRAVGETIGLIPFLGDLVGLLLDIYLFGEIPERAGYKAVGGILGGFVGALIGSFPPLIPFGGPIIGSIIGGIGGDILGGFVYDMVKGKQQSISSEDVGKSTVKSTIKEKAIKEGLITFGKGGFTGKGDSRKLAGLVHYNEQVFDQDTTLAVRQNAPGFFEDLNSAKGFESLEVLRNFASYEGAQTAMAQFIPIPIPMPRKEVPPVIDMATGEVREDLVSSYHYARG